MEIKQYQAAMEAVLFASGEPVASGRLAEVLELDEETAVRLAEDLMQDINTRGGGLRMLRLDDRYQLCTNADYAGYVRKALEIRRNTPLSQAAMEVLAIVAYNQPVTRRLYRTGSRCRLRRGGTGVGAEKPDRGKGAA